MIVDIRHSMIAEQSFNSKQQYWVELEILKPVIFQVISWY